MIINLYPVISKPMKFNSLRIIKGYNNIENVSDDSIGWCNFTCSLRKVDNKAPFLAFKCVVAMTMSDWVNLLLSTVDNTT